MNENDQKDLTDPTPEGPAEISPEMEAIVKPTIEIVPLADLIQAPSKSGFNRRRFLIIQAG